ncbi:MAG: hypothetical protein IPO27_03250 [Bacteroidetes bacterium]|nr:hypothetical protein [Bacteroidota bacterium]
MGYHYSGLVPGNAFFFKLNKYGDSTYYRTYLKDSSVVYYSAKQNDSVILVTPLIFSKNKYINLAKVSSINGDTISNWNYFLPNYPTGYSRLIFLLKNSDILLINTWAGNYNIMRLNSNGQIIWHTGTPMAGIINCIEDYDGNIIEVGADPTSIDPYHVRKLDSAGNVIWDRTYGNNWQYFSGYTNWWFVQMNDSNYLNSIIMQDCHLIKIDRNTGDTIWTRTTNSMILVCMKFLKQQ